MYSLVFLCFRFQCAVAPKPQYRASQCRPKNFIRIPIDHLYTATPNPFRHITIVAIERTRYQAFWMDCHRKRRATFCIRTSSAVFIPSLFYCTYPHLTRNTFVSGIGGGLGTENRYRMESWLKYRASCRCYSRCFLQDILELMTLRKTWI